MTTVAVDTAAVQRFVAAEDDALVEALFARRYQRTLAGLVRLEQTLAAESPDLLRATRFDECLVTIEGAGPHVQREVLGYPSAPFWLDVAENLVQRKAHVLFPHAHVLSHLERFQAFVVAAAALARLDYDAEMIAGSNGEVALAGCHQVLMPQHPVPYDRVAIRSRAGVVRGRGSAGELKAFAVPRLANGVEINSDDSDLRLAERSSFSFELLNEMAVLRWAPPLEGGFAMIARVDPALSREISAVVKTIVPVNSARPGVHVSASFREAPGLIALSWTPDSGVLAEALVHEYHHQKLNALLTIDPLVVGPDARPRYYSPWRDDPRPLLGVLHGAYAFQGVVALWSAVLASRIPQLDAGRIRQRMFLLRLQVLRAIRTLEENAEVSTLGAALIEAIAARARGLHTPLPQSDDGARGRLEEKLLDHEKKWEERNRAALPPAVHHDAGLPLYGADPLLEALIRGDADVKSVTETLGGGAFWPDVLAGHTAYIAAQYQEAAESYATAIRKQPAAPLLWQYFAFALRHRGDARGDRILHNLGALMSAGLSFGDEGQLAISVVTAAVDTVLL